MRSEELNVMDRILKIVEKQPTREDLESIAFRASREATDKHISECPARNNRDELSIRGTGLGLKLAAALLALLAAILGVKTGFGV
jgi:hypothetical protein